MNMDPSAIIHARTAGLFHPNQPLYTLLLFRAALAAHAIHSPHSAGWLTRNQISPISPSTTTPGDDSCNYNRGWVVLLQRAKPSQSFRVPGEPPRQHAWFLVWFLVIPASTLYLHLSAAFIDEMLQTTPHSRTNHCTVRPAAPPRPAGEIISSRRLARSATRSEHPPREKV